MPKKILLLHNPTAGASHPNAEELLEGIHKAIGVKPRYFSIKNPDWKDALSKRWDAVILAGGDGTVGKSVRWLRNRKTQIAILPLGTANDISRSLGIEGDLDHRDQNPLTRPSLPPICANSIAYRVPGMLTINRRRVSRTSTSNLGVITAA